MERNNLIPNVETNDLDPKTPWNLPTGEADAPAAPLKEETPAVVATPPAGPSPFKMPPHEEEKPPKKERGLFVKGILAVIIIGAIIGLGILLPIKLVPSATSLLTSIFHSSGSAATTTGSSASSTAASAIKTDKTSINSEETVKFSWNTPIRSDGVYSLNFNCQNGVNIILLGADGNKYPVACGTPFKFNSVDNTMTLAIQSRFQRLADVSLAFNFTDTAGSVSDLGTADITVINNFPESASATSTASAASNSSNGGTIVASNNSNATQAVQPAQPQTSTVSTGGGHTIFQSASGQPGTTGSITAGASNASSNSNASASSNASAAPAYSGKSDLKVAILATGVLNKSTGAFSVQSSFSSDDRVAVRFQVSNIGTNVSGPWSFSALLPTADSKTYQSGQEISLAPGSSIVFTLGFDNLSEAANAVMAITADPSNYVAESNESNNTATVSFNATGGSNGNSGTGNADLKATLVSVGRMEGTAFVADNSITTDDRAAIQFRVTNIGGQSTGSWNFEADMTRDGSDATYRSGSQQSLGAGRSTVVTVAFDNPSEGSQEFDIALDPSRNTSDANRGNNEITASIDVNN